MYLKSVNITNIKSIDHFKMEWEKPGPGWHVLIGDNGAGKTTIVRAMALWLVGYEEIDALRQSWDEWMGLSSILGGIYLEYLADEDLDQERFREKGWKEGDEFILSGNLDLGVFPEEDLVNFKADMMARLEFKDEVYYPWHWFRNKGWISCAFGPYRRFTGGSKDWEDFRSYPRAGAHITAFGEDVALTEVVKWLQYLNTEQLEENTTNEILTGLTTFINEGNLLPHGSQLVEINRNGVFFEDGNGAKLNVNQLSDGYRSILSLTMELIRQLIRTYGKEKVFADIRQGKMEINLPGVVLIDEVDAHLHPTWQTEIGYWFTKYFPQLQFIVTTHSPLICRAAENNGSIWRLAAPGSGNESGEVTGIDRDRLIYGNVLDAYSTNVFGEGIEISKTAQEKLVRLGELNMKKAFDKLTPEEEKEQHKLAAIFSTDDPSGF